MELFEILPMAAEVSGSFYVVASGSLLFSPSSVVVLSALTCCGIDVVSSEDSIFYLSFHHVNPNWKFLRLFLSIQCGQLMFPLQQAIYQESEKKQ